MIHGCTHLISMLDRAATSVARDDAITGHTFDKNFGHGRPMEARHEPTCQRIAKTHLASPANGDAPGEAWDATSRGSCLIGAPPKRCLRLAVQLGLCFSSRFFLSTQRTEECHSSDTISDRPGFKNPTHATQGRIPS